jgi:hypothetical protein
VDERRLIFGVAPMYHVENRRQAVIAAALATRPALPDLARIAA